MTPESVEYLYTQGAGSKYSMEAHLRYFRAIITADAAVTVAFYPSTVMAAANFGRFLQTNGEKLACIQILWTSAEGQLLDDSKCLFTSRLMHADSSRTTLGLNHTLALGVAACTKLQSITIGLFVGSNATSTLEEQMSCLLALVRAAHHKTLRILSLVVRVHQDNEVYQYVQELAQLNWSAVMNALAPNSVRIPSSSGFVSPFWVQRLCRHGRGDRALRAAYCWATHTHPGSAVQYPTVGQVLLNAT